MLRFHVCICAGLLLYLPQCTTGVCSDGTPRQCQEAEFAPGSNLAGEGFDITTMERKGAFVLNMDRWKRTDKKCTLCVNPFMDNKRQKLPLSVVDWRAKQSCSSKMSSSLHKSSESLLSSTSSSVENNWKVGLDFQMVKTGASLMLAGTSSKVADYSMGKTKNDKFSFASLGMTCEYYSYRVSGSPRLHKEFSRAVTQLPSVYNEESKEQFYKLIDNFGTHYISKVKLGGNVQSVTSIRQCQASLQGFSAEEVQMCLEVEASASFRVTIKTESKHCKRDVEKSENKAAFSSLFNDRFTEIKGGHTTEPDLLFSADKDPSAYKEWLNSIPQNPDIISYSLSSLHELLPANTTTSFNLRSAISHYILEKGLVINCTERCRKDSRDHCVCQCHNDPAVNQDCCPTRKGTARVIITAQRATGLWGDYFTSTDGFVKVLYNKVEYRSKVINNNNNPHWGFVVDLGPQDLSVANKVRFEVWDQDNGWDDDKLGSCEQLLKNGIIEDACNMNHGRLYFKLEVKCAPSLSGEFCRDYKPTPMNQSLKKLYVSRHAHPIPKAMLLEMGVFVNKSSTATDSGMFLLSFSICAGLLLCFPWCSTGVCTDGKPKECADADFAPGSNLAGEGFDITKMERKSAFVLDMMQWKRKDKTCTLCVNPFLEGKKMKLPLSVLDWRAKQSCSAKVSSKLHKSSEALVSSSTSSVENNWKTELDVELKDKSGKMMLAGTNSKLADYSMEKTKNDKFSFASTSMSCEYYSYRVSSTPKLNRDFNKAVKKLPKVYSPENKSRFYTLIDVFGTHYITKVKLGGQVESVTSIANCEASLQGLKTEEIEMCLEAEASASVKVNMKAESKHCHKAVDKMDNKNSFSDIFRDRFTEIKGGLTTDTDLLFSANKNPEAYKEWLGSVPQYPDIISYSLSALHKLLPENTPVRKNLRKAISHYILEKGLWRNCSEHCQAGIRTDSRDSCVCQCHNEPAVNSDCCPTRKGMARVVIMVQRATDLWGDHSTATDGYVKVFVNKQEVYRSSVIQNNNNPKWESIIDLETKDISSGNVVRFEVWDQDNNWDDDLLGECERRLSAGVLEDVCPLQHGRLFFKWEVKCIPNLTGDLCLDYNKSRMSQSLRSLYVSRHAHPIPKSILVKMGVFVNEGSSHRNESLAVKPLV
ncbi:uncharacterized protein FYW61_017248 [Anableps anableps]